MTFMEALDELRYTDYASQPTESRSYMTRGHERVVIAGQHLYNVTLYPTEKGVNVVSMPWNPCFLDYFDTDWEVRDVL